jgi:enoyl-CoA hydratase
MIEVDGHGAVRVVRMRHGKVNALDLELLLALQETFRELRDAAVVLTGAGHCFSAGVDLRRVLEAGPDYAAAFLPALTGACRAVFEHPRPVVAAVNGHAIAGGCILAAACDRRFMAAGTIGVTELAVGVPYPSVPMEVLRFVAGPAAADLALSARTMGPQEALRVGLVDAVAAPDELLERALAEAGRLARIPAAAFALTKRQLRRDAVARMDAGRADDELVLAGWTDPGGRAAIAAFFASL